MFSAPSFASSLARRTAQVRHLSSLSSFTQVSGGANAPVQSFLTSYDRCAPNFATGAQRTQSQNNRQLFPSNQVIDLQRPDNNNLSDLEAIIQATNRNGRGPKKANKGSRPCSRVGRRRKQEKVGKRSRGRG
eukprot:jgi/Psemu1/301162/fgenesh1_kg.26_\